MRAFLFLNLCLRFFDLTDQESAGSFRKFQSIRHQASVDPHKEAFQLEAEIAFIADLGQCSGDGIPVQFSRIGQNMAVVDKVVIVDME